MKNKVCLALLLIASLFVCTTSRATLIGDTISVTREFASLGAIVDGPKSTIVQAGTADQLSFFGGNILINPEASSVSIAFLSSSFFNDATFNGFVFSSIDDTLTGFSIATNLVGWSDSRFLFDDHSFSANFQGLSFTPSSTFVATLTTTPSGVPDSGSSLGLLTFGILGLASVARRFRTKN